jgi:hypothetical protein
MAIKLINCNTSLPIIVYGTLYKRGENLLLVRYEFIPENTIILHFWEFDRNTLDVLDEWENTLEVPITTYTANVSVIYYHEPSNRLIVIFQYMDTQGIIHALIYSIDIDTGINEYEEIQNIGAYFDVRGLYDQETGMVVFPTHNEGYVFQIMTHPLSVNYENVMGLGALGPYWDIDEEGIGYCIFDYGISRVYWKINYRTLEGEPIKIEGVPGPGLQAGYMFQSLKRGKVVAGKTDTQHRVYILDRETGDVERIINIPLGTYSERLVTIRSYEGASDRFVIFTTYSRYIYEVNLKGKWTRKWLVGIEGVGGNFVYPREIGRDIYTGGISDKCDNQWALVHMRMSGKIDYLPVIGAG